MSDPRSTYRACRELFASFPQAAHPVDAAGAVSSMVLMLQAGGHPGFFVLSQDSRHTVPSYQLWPWPTGDVVTIAAEDRGLASETAEDAVEHGVPIPHDGSLFGWIHGGELTALIVVYAESVADFSEPAWSVMPRVGTSSAQWPPFTGKPLFGHWSWDASRSGRLISLDRAVASVPGVVWWVDTKDVLGSDCCVVERDLEISPGTVLRRGRYVYFQVLEDDEPIPALGDILKDPRRLDLAPAFQPEPDDRACSAHVGRET